MRFPLEDLAPVITHMKSYSRAFLTIFAKIVHVGVQGIEEETILPVIDLIIERTCQVFSLSHSYEISGETQIDWTPYSPTQSLTHLPRVGDGFDQINNHLPHHDSQTQGAQETVLVFESFGCQGSGLNSKLVTLLVGHQEPFAGEQVNKLFGVDEEKDLSFPLGSF